MAASVLVDAGFLVALLTRRDDHHRWAIAQASRFPASLDDLRGVVSEAFHLFAGPEVRSLAALLRRGALVCRYRLAGDMDAVLRLKYADVPMSFAAGCLVGMTETLNNPMLLTTDTDFRIYRRHV